MLGFGFNFGFTRTGGAAGWIGYLLNALGFATSGEQTLTAPDPVLALDWEGTLTDFGSATNSDSVAVSAIPGSRLSGGVVYDDDGSGNPLHPSVTTGGVTDYVFYPTHEVSTAYASDKFVWAEASDGSTRYYSSSGGTSGGSAPTFPTSGTVVDNDITWTYEGRYGIKGQRVEGAATNVILQSRDPDTTWTQRGTFSAVQDLVGADGEANSGWTLSGIDTAAVGDLYQLMGSLTTGTRYEPSFILKQIDTSGDLKIYNLYTSEADGRWDVDLSKLSSSWETVDRSHPAVTVVNEFTTGAGVGVGIIIIKESGTGTLSVGYHNSQLELGEISTSQIETTTSTVTRSAVNLTIPTSETELTAAEGAARLVITPLATGQVGKIWASYTDASNELSVDLTATTITLNKKVAGSTDQATKTYTHAKGEQIVIDFVYGSVGMSINSFVVGATAGSAGTNAATSAAVLGTNIQFGASNDLSHINATFDMALKSYTTEAEASADIDTWSL